MSHENKNAGSHFCSVSSSRGDLPCGQSGYGDVEAERGQIENRQGNPKKTPMVVYKSAGMGMTRSSSMEWALTVRPPITNRPESSTGKS